MAVYAGLGGLCAIFINSYLTFLLGIAQALFTFVYGFSFAYVDSSLRLRTDVDIIRLQNFNFNR